MVAFELPCSDDSGDVFESAFVSLPPSSDGQFRLAAELPQPVVDILLQQRNGRLDRGFGRRFFTLASCSDQLGIPRIAIDGFCSASPRGALHLVVARHDDQPPRGRILANQCCDPLVGRLPASRRSKR